MRCLNKLFSTNIRDIRERGYRENLNETQYARMFNIRELMNT